MHPIHLLTQILKLISSIYTFAKPIYNNAMTKLLNINMKPIIKYIVLNCIFNNSNNNFISIIFFLFYFFYSTPNGPSPNSKGLFNV